MFQTTTHLTFFVLASFAFTSACLSTISYSFTSQATSVYQQPSYPLGNLPIASTLTITLQLPNPNSATLSSFIVIIKDASNTLPLTFLSFTETTPSANWTVTATGNYYIQITTGSDSMSSVGMYYLSASLNSSPPFFKATDVLRKQMFRYFYVAPNDPSTITITISPEYGTSILLYTMNTLNQLLISNTKTLSPSSVSNGIATYTASKLSTGYYALYFTVPSVLEVIISFQTSSYPCPYLAEYPDYYGCFSGCLTSSSSNSPGWPCKNYNYNTLTCLECLQGYDLNNGKCVLPSQCSTRQYFKLGNCYPVSSQCDLYNALTGQCYTCISPNQFNVINGQCIASNITLCPNNTYLSGSYCISIYCSAVFYNGSCSACVSTAFYLTAGTCQPIECGNQSYFSVKLNNCTTIPLTCANFSLLNQLCEKCSSGYVLQNGVCLKSSSSLNCKLLDAKTNICGECLPNYSLKNGSCQVTPANTPIYCPAGQFLVNKACTVLPNGCMSLNSFYECTECAKNYQIANGKCIACAGSNPAFPCIICPTNYYVNSLGICTSVSPYCATSNPLTGFCLTCSSNAAPINGICCPSGQTVENGICSSPSSSASSNSGTIIKDSSYFTYCLYYMPPCNCCIQCRTGYYFDYADHCAIRFDY